MKDYSEKQNRTIVLEVTPYGDEDKRYYRLDEDDVSHDLICKDDGTVVQGAKGSNGLLGFYDGDRWILEDECESFDIVSVYDELRREIDFYGTGYDRILAKIDGELIFLRSSRWTSGSVQNYLKFVSYADGIYREELTGNQYNVFTLGIALISIGCNDVTGYEDWEDILKAGSVVVITDPDSEEEIQIDFKIISPSMKGESIYFTLFEVTAVHDI